MLVRVSAIGDYDLVFSGDPALDAPGDDATDEERKVWGEKLDRARETGDWSSLLKPGAAPTIFTMRPFTGSERRELMDWLSSPALGPNVKTTILFRAALRGVKNLGDAEVKRATDPASGLTFQIATRDVADQLDAIDMGIVGELSLAVLHRLGGLRPKS